MGEISLRVPLQYIHVHYRLTPSVLELHAVQIMFGV